MTLSNETSDFEHDLVIRGGTIVDGTGAKRVPGDVAIKNGTISQVGCVPGRGESEIDALGCIVTPGFIDVHTHYDGHVTWGDRLLPSANHGVTTAVMGNCGVGFAPCRPQDREKLIRLMEGVEDIPGIVMTEGLPWEWTSFPEYLDFLAARRFDMDVAAYLPHAALRVFAMGDRAVRREPADSEDIALMRATAVEAINAGAVGFSTSRTINHRSSSGEMIFSLTAGEEELKSIVSALDDAQSGVFQLISDFDEPKVEFGMVRRVIGQSQRPLTFSLMQMPVDPQRWETLLELAETAQKEGLAITAQVIGRPVGILCGLELSVNPFSFCPAYQELADLPLDDRLDAMRDPQTRALITSQYPGPSDEPIAQSLTMSSRMYALEARPDYTPDPANSMANHAARRGVGVAEYLYDYLVSGDGRNKIYLPVANYCNDNTQAIERMLRSPVTIPGLGDGGAHCGVVCDASQPTYLMMRWAGDEDGALSLEKIVQSLTLDCAAAMEFADRGTIEVGKKADLNVIDLASLDLFAPEMIYDLPLGSGRLNQKASGYRATIVSGQVTYRDGVATGVLPGRLVRGSGWQDDSANAALAAAT